MAKSGYPNQFFRTFDERFAQVPPFENWRKAVDVVIDDVRLGATPVRMRTPLRAETRFEKKFEEAVALALTLAIMDLHDGATLRSWEREGMPDFTGTIGGVDRAVEIANVTESAHADSILSRLRNDVDSLPVASNRFVSISFPMVPSPAKFKLSAAVEDIRLLAVDPTLRQYEPVPSSAGELANAKARITVAEFPRESGYLEVTSTAHGFNPTEMVRVAITELHDKQARATRYTTDLPLWVVLYISDSNGYYRDSVVGFAELRPDVRPIERVFVTDGLLVADSALWEDKPA
jgi:hypothetical protein